MTNDFRNQASDPLPAEQLAAQLAAGIWQHLAAEFADAPDLAAEINCLRTELAGVRLDRANLAAAAMATIAAYHDGEPDPLSYLIDELQVQGYEAGSRGSR